MPNPACHPTPPAPFPARHHLAAALLLWLWVGAAAASAATLPAADQPPTDIDTMIYPHQIYAYLAPGTVLLKINTLEFKAETFVEAALAQLAPADRNALIQSAQIREELRARNIAVTDREIDQAAQEFAAAFSQSLPPGQSVTPDQLTAVLGVDRAMFKQYIARFAGLRRLLIADGQITAANGIADPTFQSASESYLKLLQLKYPPRAGEGDAYLIVGQIAIAKSEAVRQYRAAVWSKAYQTAPVEDLVGRTRAATDALNTDVLSILDRILRYKVVYARWSALNRTMTPEFKDQVFQDIKDALAVKRGALGNREAMIDEFLRQRKTTRDAFLKSYEFEMTCMLSQLVADRLEDPVLKQTFADRPGDYGKGDPIVRMIFVPTRDEDDQDLPHVAPTGLAGVDAAYEKIRRVASAHARESLRLAETTRDEKGFLAAADEYNQDPLTRSEHGLIGRVPPTAKDPRFTPALMAEIARLAALPPKTPGLPVEGADGWYLFQVDSLENPDFESVRRRVFLDVIGRERVKLQDQLMHTATLEGLFAPAYRAWLDADWQAKYETPDRDLPAPAPEARP